MNPYALEPELRDMKGLWAAREILLTPCNKKEEEEYAFLLNEAHKMTGRLYIELHKQMERHEISLNKLREWIHYAEKSDNKGMCFNGLLKKYKLARIPR